MALARTHSPRERSGPRSDRVDARAARWLAPRFVSVARLRAGLATVLEELDRPTYLTQRGEPRAVLLTPQDYEALIEQLEHLYDSLEAALGHERLVRGEQGRALDEVLRDLSRKPRERKRSARGGRSRR